MADEEFINPDDVPMAGVAGQSDVEVLTLMRDRHLAKAAATEARGAKNTEALRRRGQDRLEGDARSIVKKGAATATDEAVRLRRLAEALNAAIAAMSDDGKKRGK